MTAPLSTPRNAADERVELIKDLRHFAAAFRGEGKEIEADLMDEAATALLAQSERGMPSKQDIVRCTEFWRHYSHQNEPAQDDLTGDRDYWIAEMEKWSAS